MKKGFSVFLTKIITLWVIVIGLMILMLFNQENENVETSQVSNIIEQPEYPETTVHDLATEKTNRLTIALVLIGFGLLMTVIYLLGSRCPKCGEWFAMGKTINERVPTGMKSKTKTRSKFGFGSILALFNWRLWWLGLRSGGDNSKTDTKVTYGIKKTRFCQECGYELTKIPK